MSTHPSTEMANGVAAKPSAFSYAQAAKGQSTPPNGAGDFSNPANNDALERNGETLDKPQVGGLDRPGHKDDWDSVKQTNGQQAETPESGAEPVPKNEALERNPAETTQEDRGKTSTSQERPTAPSSQQLGAEPVVQPLEGDDVFTIQHEGHSTWEKGSEESPTEASGNKVEGDGDDSKLSTWEHVQKPQFKEAPPPTVNFWQKRAMDAQAKAKDTKSFIPQSQQSQGSAFATEGPQEPAKRNHTAASARRDVSAKSRSPEGHAPHKGSRTPEKSKASGDMAPPPPPSDATSWPTPSLAKEEDKKKAFDREERVDKEKTPNRPHGKERWEKIDYVPNAVFNTPIPLPRRGGRLGGRGGREGGTRGGHAANGGPTTNERSVSGPNSTAASSNATPPNERSKVESGQAKYGQLDPKTGRSASAGPPSTREQPRATDGAHDRRDDGTGRHFSGKPFRDNRRISLSNQADPSQRPMPHTGGNNRRTSVISDQLPEPSASGEYVPSRAPQGDGYARSQDWGRDVNGYNPSRERREGRLDRGRGGFRSKGPQNHANYNGNGNPQANGQAFGPNKLPYHPEQRLNSQPYASSFSSGREPRHNRGPSRSQSIAHPSGYNRFMNGAPSNGPNHLNPLQIGIANMYSYPVEHQAPMSAVNFHPYMEQMQIQGIVQMQMEYYFSVGNLCKDMFLRKNMDSQGFVFLHVVQNFNRIKKLTEDLDLIRFVCARSQSIELRTGPDGLDRVRKAGDWQQWVLNMEERDPPAQNDGPGQIFSPYFPPQYPLPMPAPYDYPRGSLSSTPLSPKDSFAGNGNSAEPAPFDGNGPSGQISDPQPTQTPLSAAVPDFKPSYQVFDNPSYESVESSTEFEGNFSDDNIDRLTILLRRSKNTRSKDDSSSKTPQETVPTNNNEPELPLAHDKAGIDSEAKPKEPEHTNGVTERRYSAQDAFSDKKLESTQDSSQFVGAYIGPSDNWSAGPTYWWPKGKSTEAATNAPDDFTTEYYVAFRSRALQLRERASDKECHSDMAILYNFWTHFLIQNLNFTMYDEFRTFALKDVTERESATGLEHLVNFYYEWLLGPNIIPDRLAKDFIDIVHTDTGKTTGRPAFNALKAAWRNNGLNFKSRVKVDGLINKELRAELES